MKIIKVSKFCLGFKKNLIYYFRRTQLLNDDLRKPSSFSTVHPPEEGWTGNRDSEIGATEPEKRNLPRSEVTDVGYRSATHSPSRTSRTRIPDSRYFHLLSGKKTRKAWGSGGLRLKEDCPESCQIFQVNETYSVLWHRALGVVVCF